MSAIINSLRAMVQSAPDRWESRLGLIEALLNEGLHDEATQVLQEVEELPAELEEQVLAGRAYGLVDPEIGLEVLEQILQTEPTYAPAHFEKARLCYLKNDLENAQKHYFTAITFDANLTDPSFAAELTGGISQPTVAMHGIPDPVVPQTASPVTNPATQNNVVTPPVDRDHVYYPDPGEYPTIPLSEALAVTNIQPLVHPDAIPDHPELAYQEDVQYVETENIDQQQYWEQLNNVEVHTALQPTPITYDYQEPDDSIFDPTITPDDIYVGALVTNNGEPVANLQESIRRNKAQKDSQIAKREKVAKIQSVVAALITVGVICLLLALAVVASPRPAPPQIVASAAVAPPDDSLKETRMINQKSKTTPTPPQSSSFASMEVLTVASASDISTMSFDSPMMDLGASSLEMGFSPSMSLGEVGGAASMSFFGTKTKGRTAVIFDVSDSMYGSVPKVVKEIKRSFKDAPVVALMGCGFGRSIYGEAERLLPYKENDKLLGWVSSGQGEPELRKIMNDALFSLDNCTSLPIPEGMQKQAQNVGNAIELLLNQSPSKRPATIFVFADYRDKLVPEYLSELKKLLIKRKVKLVIYQAEDEFGRPDYHEILKGFIQGIEGEIKIGM